MKLGLASDFDGTFYFEGQQPPCKEVDIQAIHAFQQAGHLFGCCTGRDYDSIRQPLKSIDLTLDYYIVASGAAILDAKGNICFERLMAQKDIDGLFEKYHGKADMYLRGRNNTFAMQAHAESSFRAIHIQRPDQVGADAFIQGVSFGCYSKEDAQWISESVNQTFEDIVAYRNVTFVDIVSRDCSKGNGCQKAKELFGIDRLGGIGDFYNDLPLFEGSDVSFTFDRSPASLQKQVDHVVTDLADAVHILMEENK
ncbi:MAG: HAD hydrolase family protein [Erysipelotrichaceae bacterium]|nr:HAD hydrolase family protein [Erysipelotrichaceae bacterium]